MMGIQKKSLQHISNLLSSIDSYDLYRSLSNVMEAEGISNEVKSRVLDKFQTGYAEINAKIKDAKEWIDTVVSDV